MAGPEELVREVSRIVASPYPPSLAKLADLCAGVEPLAIRACLHNCPPCAIKKLASTVSAALTLWQHTVVVLRSLSHSFEFTNALLLQSPGLLDALLTKANSSDHAFEQYAELCVTLLSRSLPESVILPASAQTFFFGAFERAANNPQVQSLNLVYRMLKGACRGLLNTLPVETRDVFDAKLKHILSSTRAGQNCMLLMWCYGITILAEHPEAAVTTPTLRWETLSGQKLFGSNINKTIDLAYVAVVWAAKGDVDVSDTEALEGIRIATQTLQCIDMRVRERWPNSGDFAKKMFAKLPEKILRRGIHPAVQLEALSFYAMIAGKQNLQPDMIRVYETNLPRVLSLTDAISIRDSLSTSLPLFAPHMQERTISALLLTILKASISPTSVREVATMQAVVTELTTVFPECPQLRSNVVAALSSEDLQSTIQRFLHVDVEGPEYSGAQVCKPFAAAMHRALVSATISLILASLLGFGSVARSLPESLGLTLLKKHEQLPFIPDRCDHTAAVRSIPSVSLFQQECTPLSGVHLQDWRERLESELQNQSYYARDSVVRSVLQICHDLESRCQTVEEPLRQEKEKSNRLEGELCELRERLAAVELKRWEDGEHLAALDSENEKLEQEKEHLSEMLARLRQDFDNANTKADETLREAREQYRTAEVQLRSTVLAREDEIRLRKQEIQELHAAVASCGDEVGRTKLVVEAQQQNIQAYKQEIQQLHTAKQALSDNYDESRERLGVLNLKHDDLRVELADTTRLIELEREKTAASTSEIDELKSKDRELKTHLQDTKSELTNVVKRLEDAQNRHQELAQSSAEALKDSKRQFDRAKSKAAEEHNRLNADLQEALRNGRDVSEAYEEVQRQLAELQSAVPPLEAKIEELANVRLDQEEEIEGLRAWKSRVMDSMGFPPEPPRRAALGPNTELGDPRTPHQHRRRQSAIQMQTRDVAPKGPSAMQAISSTAIENVANASSTSSESHFSQSGSTPKRARPRHQFKVPSMHTPYNKKPLVTSKSVSRKLSPTKRSILRPISPNRRHTTVGFAIAEDEEEQELTQDLPMRKRRGSLQDAGQADFNMDEFVAGTPLTPGAFTSGTGRIVDEDGSVTEL